MCGQHRVVHCSQWDWGAECWVVVWCNIKTFTAFTTPNSSLLPVQSLINPQKWNIARDCCFCEQPFRSHSATEMRVTDTASCHIFSLAKHFFCLLYTLKNKGCLLAMTVPSRTFNIHGTFPVPVEKSLQISQIFFTQIKNGSFKNCSQKGSQNGYSMASLQNPPLGPLFLRV